MGNRVSISFKKDNIESVVLFSHWGGKEFVKKAKRYVKELKNEISKENSGLPLYRLDPGTVIVDFIKHLECDNRIQSNYYLGKDKNDGDNSDNGHFVIKL